MKQLRAKKVDEMRDNFIDAAFFVLAPREIVVPRILVTTVSGALDHILDVAGFSGKRVAACISNLHFNGHILVLYKNARAFTYD